MNNNLPKNSPLISVIIPTYNRAQMVCKCIQSVLATQYPALEVIVVDDCSPDDTQAQLQSAFSADSRVKVYRNAHNSFQAVSRNKGRQHAKGEYLLFLDDDNIVHPTILTSLIDVFKTHPKAGFVAPMAIHQRKAQQNAIWSLGSDFNQWTSCPKDLSPNLPLNQLPEKPTLYPTTYYPNGFMVKADVFDQVGGFDEKYEQIFEESDFGWLIHEAEYECFISTEARTDHYGFLEPGCVSELRQLGIEKTRRTFCFARNRLRFARKHFNFFQILSVTLIFAPLSCIYYSSVAIRHHRWDIAWAYCRGTLAGILFL